MRDFDIDGIPHQGIRDLLRWARSIGVTIKDLDDVPREDEFGIDYSLWAQAFMKKHYRASRCPDDTTEGFHVYVSFGRPAQNRRGTIYLGARAEDAEEWDAGDYAPEVILLHEIAHAVVGPETNTCTWETAATRTLYGESREPESIWEQMKGYQNGSTCSERWPHRERRVERRLEAYGVLPIRVPGCGVQLDLPWRKKIRGYVPRTRE